MSRWAMPILLVVFAVAARAAGPKAGCPRDCCVVSGKDAFCLGAPELVSGQFVKSVSWAPTGRALLVERDTRLDESKAGEIVLSTWNMESHRLTDVWRRSAGEWEISEREWLGGSSVAIFTVQHIAVTRTAEGDQRDGEVTGFWWVDAAKGLCRPVNRPALGSRTAVEGIHPSPALPLAVARLTSGDHTPNGPEWVWVLRADGAAGPVAALPQGCAGGRWLDDGRQFLVARRTNAPAPGIRPTYDWFAFDPSTGRIAPCDAPGPERPGIATPEPFSIEERLGEARAGSSSARVPTIWMQSSQPDAYPRALVATGAASAELSPTRDALAYRINGSLWVRPIVRKTVEQFEKEYRDWATGAAKQLNLAIMMYVQDYDEIYPLQSSVQDSVMPYLKDADMLGELHFALNGEKLSDIATPVNFELGYVDGPGGRAVMYADGHVKWQPRK